MMRLLLPSVALSLAMIACGSAAAQNRWVDEGKLGLSAHDMKLGGEHEEPGADVKGEVLFTSPDLFTAIGRPRPHLGVSVNTAGATNYAYIGLTWTGEFFERAFASAALGGAIHDGELNADKPHRKQLGSRVLFHEYVELGYRLTPIVSVSLFLDHMSNANLARHNAGLTDLGVRVGYKF